MTTKPQRFTLVLLKKERVFKMQPLTQATVSRSFPYIDDKELSYDVTIDGGTVHLQDADGKNFSINALDLSKIAQWVEFCQDSFFEMQKKGELL